MGLKMSDAETSRALSELNQSCTSPWQMTEGMLNKSFIFNDFAEAFDFMTRIAKLAEAADHHPDWCNSYNRVTINLTTHEVGGLSSRDFALASKIEDLK